MAIGNDATTTPSPRMYLNPLFSWRGCINSPSSGLPPTVRLVALALSLHMNERGGSAFPSIKTLAGECSLHDRTVQRCLRILADGGWLTVKRGGGRGFSNLYEATVPERVAQDHPYEVRKGGAEYVKGGAEYRKGGTPPPKDVPEDDKRSLGDPTCEVCGGDGWKTTTAEDHRLVFVEPCSCR